MTRSHVHRSIVLSALLGALAAGCGHYVPALFAARPTVTVVHDDRPIDVPSNRRFDERDQISDIYLRRPLFDVVRPLDFPTAGDVNAMDEVPTSSWYDPAQPVLTPSELTPPAPPLMVLDETPATTAEALVVRDARGARYELLDDPADQPGLFTGAEVLGGFLIRSLGLRAPRSWVDHLLWHHACHTVDMFIYQTGGVPTQIYGVEGPHHPELGIAMDLAIIMKAANGAICTLSTSFNNDGPIGSPYRYICDNGTYIAFYDNLEKANGEKVDTTGVDVSGNGFENQDREFIKAIKDNRQPNSSVEDALRAMQTLDKVEQQFAKNK